MPWVVLFISSALEAVWATALGASDGFSKTGPTIVFLTTLVFSMVSLAYVAKHIPMSIAYAVWSGAGAAFTVAWAMATGSESTNVFKVLFLIGIIGCIVGLKLLNPQRQVPEPVQHAPAGDRPQ